MYAVKMRIAASKYRTGSKIEIIPMAKKMNTARAMSAPTIPNSNALDRNRSGRTK